MLHIHDVAPEFSLNDQEGRLHSLADYKGKWVVLYFYPKDNTPGCTVEACSFRDHWQEVKAKAVVLGISTDSAESHQKFAAKYHLPFLLLADPDKQVVTSYQVWAPKKFMGKTYIGTHRTSFLVDPSGTIAKIYENVKPANHASEIVADLNQFQS